MSIATRLRWYLDSRGIEYEVLPHSHTSTSLETAKAARVSSEHIAKCVILEDERGYVMAILPASCRIALKAIRHVLHRQLELASEPEIMSLFADCETGAVPPVAEPYGIPAVVDDRLWGLTDVWFEAGDHEELVHMTGEDFEGLLGEAQHARFTRRVVKIH